MLSHMKHSTGAHCCVLCVHRLGGTISSTGLLFTSCAEGKLLAYKDIFFITQGNFSLVIAQLWFQPVVRL